LPPADFIWAVGIEDTAIGTPIRDGGRSLDEYQLTEHYDRWRSDLELIGALGCNVVRYGLPWYRLNPAPGQWDWAWLDDVLNYAVTQVGLTVIADLVHYGTPNWLPGAFADPGYPDAIAEFGGAVAQRYGNLIRHYTPLNEPLVTASFCGQRAVWPPYGTGNQGWARVVLGAVSGMQRTVQAIRRAQHDAVIVHVEATNVLTTQDESLRDELRHNQMRSLLPTDLFLGRVNREHPMYQWILEQGVPTGLLREVHDNGQQPDLIGVNYYPQLSCRELVQHNDEVVAVVVDGGRAGLETVLDQFYGRYGLPLLVAETGVDGPTSHHIDWLNTSVDAVLEARDRGVPVVGYTWWPLYDFVDWSWASAGRTVEEFFVRETVGDKAGQLVPVNPPGGTGDGVDTYLRRMGIYRLESTSQGLERRPTKTVEAYRLAATREGPPIGEKPREAKDRGDGAFPTNAVSEAP
jgi:beta-glucosidase/6-phospho-beta-glucosidase/beta-galactosidase